MDAVLTAALQSAPQLGIGGVAVWLVVLLLRRESSSEERHTVELKRVNDAHDAELSELRADIAALRKQVDDLQLKLDIEREERRKAEDSAAEVLRRSGGGSS
ncbi:hypothetical protein [Saccharopolyspora taberi]|uniref:DUF2746 domain-containing protein n=1 Tax=Saccharopolyspora taberi TaxID=60895 RepID=A0ABN3V0U9_9PSEU